MLQKLIYDKWLKFGSEFKLPTHTIDMRIDGSYLQRSLVMDGKYLCNTIRSNCIVPFDNGEFSPVIY